VGCRVIENENSVYLHLYKSCKDSHLLSVHQNGHLTNVQSKMDKIKKIPSHNFSTLFHMPFKDHIYNLSQINNIIFSFLQDHFKKFQNIFFFTFLSTCHKNISAYQVPTKSSLNQIYIMHRWSTKDAICSLITVKTELSNEMHISQGHS